MNDKDRTRELIENMEFQADQAMHDRIKNSIRSASAQHHSSSGRRWALVAAAAIVLVVVSLVVMTPRREEAPNWDLTLASTNTLSMRSMHLAFHNDGLDGLEEHLDASLTQVGPRPTDGLMRGLYDEIGL